MAESQSMAGHRRRLGGYSEEEHGSVEAVALGRDTEVGALREGVGEAKRKREDPADAGDNFCVLYRECQLDLNS